MTDTTEIKKSTQQENEDTIDLGTLLHDFFRGIAKFWWAVVLLTVISACVGLVRSELSYRPMYKSEATFTVSTQYSNSTNYYYSFIYDTATAAQMAATFPYILSSDLLFDRVKQDLGVQYINGYISASAVENSNIFTISVVSAVPQDALNILEAVIHNYPDVAAYVIGENKLNMINEPVLASEPYNGKGRRSATMKGALVGFALGMLIILLYAFTRNTIRK